jgi:hypothetical protein
MIEMRNVRQETPGQLRRWFFDDHFDLIAWYKAGQLLGFQLCYDKPYHEKALTWFQQRGLSHHKVDSGEQSPWHNRSPMLTESDGRTEMGELLDSFRTAHIGVPAELVEAVEIKIREYGESGR